MSLKLMVPFAGLSGTIASVVGVSNSNYRSEKPAETTPSHSWEAQTINSIELIFNCLNHGNAGVSQCSNCE